MQSKLLIQENQFLTSRLWIAHHGAVVSENHSIKKNTVKIKLKIKIKKGA